MIMERRRCTVRQAIRLSEWSLAKSIEGFHFLLSFLASRPKTPPGVLAAGFDAVALGVLTTVGLLGDLPVVVGAAASARSAPVAPPPLALAGLRGVTTGGL